jgi:hypothetical protein
MGSQLDLDQGGTFRQWTKMWMGPSVGWVPVPVDAVLNITAGGTYSIARGTSLILLNVNASVTLNLPSSLASPAGPQALPGQWVINPITIVDIGGFANPGVVDYDVVPFGAETISSLASVQLASAFGSLILNPILATGGWNLIQ